ncbi:MAG: hypothetical protein ABL895_11470 [Cyclobacteriaceae bacterium]
MRLGQLARKLAVRPSQIVDYLSTHQIYLEEGSNAKLNDEHVDRIVLHFAPDRLKEIAADIKTEESVESIAQSIVTEEPDKEYSQPEILESEADKLERPEVIKAPKVELSGLKVLGKIELPEPKKKDQPVPEPASEETKTERQEQGRQRPENRKPQSKSKWEATQQPWRNPIAVQREREAREAEERKREAAERDKERRKEHYLKRVNVGQPTKPARIIDEPMELHITQKSDERPRSLWGRFMKWLNG